MTAGRVWAYVGAVLGGSVSIAANVAHSYVPPVGAVQDWRPHTGAVAVAAVWPVIALLGLEILARNRPEGLLRVTARAGMVPVVAVAAFVSYRHLSGLLAFYGEDGWSAGLGPLAVDGLMVMAAAVLLDGRESIQDTAADPVQAPVQEQPVDGPGEPSTARPRRPADELAAKRRRTSRKPSRTASTRKPTAQEQGVMDEFGVSRSKAAAILKQRRAEAEA